MSYFKTYLPVVTRDYFGRLRHTHAQTFRDMDPELQDMVRPWFSGPDRGLRFPLFKTAMHGALGNFLGDIARSGELAETETRAETAIQSSLTLGLIAITKDTRFKKSPERPPANMAIFYSQITAALTTGERMQPETGLDQEEQTAALALASYIHERIGLNDYKKRRKYTAAFRDHARWSELQFMANPNDIKQLKTIAMMTGLTTMRLVLGLTEMIDGKSYTDCNEAVFALGKEAGYGEHGSQLWRAVRDDIPTYGRAILLQAAKDGQPIRSAIKEVNRTRDELVAEAHQAGRPGLNERQRDIYDMAGMLMRRTFGVRREIEKWREVGKPQDWYGAIAERVA